MNRPWYERSLRNSLVPTERRPRSHRILDPVYQRERFQNSVSSPQMSSMPASLILRRRRTRQPLNQKKTTRNGQDSAKVQKPMRTLLFHLQNHKRLLHLHPPHNPGLNTSHPTFAKRLQFLKFKPRRTLSNLQSN